MFAAQGQQAVNRDKIANFHQKKKAKQLSESVYIVSAKKNGFIYTTILVLSTNKDRFNSECNC